MIVVTAGDKYLDIDAYASCVAYTKLLNSVGENAVFASSAIPNSSVSNIVRKYDEFMVADYLSKEDDQFVVLDVSHPEFIDKIVHRDKIIEIIDHHTGFEDYWKNKNCRTQIEFIGSVATMILEKIVEAGKIEILDSDLCKLLVSAILDNTLNLKSSITTDRDIDAYNALREIGQIEPDFDEKYFKSCQEDVNSDVVLAIKKDIKNEFVSDLLPTVFGQLTIFDKEPILDACEDIFKLFAEYKKPWLLNIICIKDGKSYILSNDKTAQQNLEVLFNAKFENNVLVLDKFMLRKQIMKHARSFTTSDNIKTAGFSEN